MQPAERIGLLLGELRRAAIAGDLARLAELGPELDLCCGELAASAPDAPTLRRIAEDAAANMGPLEAAMSGIRAARIRLAEIRRAARGIGTYDRGGQAQLIPPPPRGTIHRA